ncbi:hypothetical protein F478_03915, partial [Pseudomonas sp. URIL14HWK12:I2]
IAAGPTPIALAFGCHEGEQFFKEQLLAPTWKLANFRVGAALPGRRTGRDGPQSGPTLIVLAFRCHVAEQLFKEQLPAPT